MVESFEALCKMMCLCPRQREDCGLVNGLGACEDRMQHMRRETLAFLGGHAHMWLLCLSPRVVEQTLLTSHGRQCWQSSSRHGNWTQGRATAVGHLLVNSFRVSPINHHPYCTMPKAHPCKPPTKQLSCSVAGPRKRRALFRRPCLAVQ